jgi:hypothetical protein
MSPSDALPISQLVQSRMEAAGLTRTTLVAALGYANRDRGLRRLDDLLRQGKLNPFLAERLPAALGLAAGELEAAHAESQRLLRGAAEEAARAAFRPHVLVETRALHEVPMFLRAWLAEGGRLPLPEELAGWPLRRQREFVARLVRAHFLRHGGRMAGLGRILGYAFRRTHEHTLRFATDGRLLEAFAPRPAARPVLSVAGRPLEPARWLPRGS